MKTHTFTAGFLSSGIGVGADGLCLAVARLGADRARFKNLGGVDIDPDACRDFEYLTGAPALCRDLFEMQPHELRAFWGDRRPDVVFSSPPCKGYSRLLGRAAAEQPKYQKLNTLVHVEISLVLATYPDDPPPLLVIENVPGIATRGKHLLVEVRRNLAAAGYRFHESTHDCGEIGGLAQHRRRYLFVARRERALRAYVYQPPKKRVRGCGEVLGTLPLPEDPAAGELHRMPRISALNWLRLALIPPGGDWRDLPKAVEPAPNNPAKHEAKYRVTPFDAPLGAVTGASRPGSGSPSVADPRVAVTDNPARHANKFEVQRFDEPVRTITGVAGVATGAPNVADPRIPLAQSAAAADDFKGRPGLFGVIGWEDPSQAVTGNASISGSNTPSAVADPRVSVGARRRGTIGVLDWRRPASTVTGSMEPAGSNTPASIADPRVPLQHQPYRGALGVNDWAEPAPTVRGDHDARKAPAAVADPRLTSPLAPGQARREVFRREPVNAWDEPVPAVTGPGGSQGAQNVADPRVPLGCEGRNGFYGVLDWNQPSGTVTGSLAIDNGAAAVADPRLGQPIALDQALEDFARITNARKAPPKPPVIVAADGTWHRPLTDLELGALQGIPAVVRGKPLRLSRGGGMSTIRERIGNAVPREAATAIGESLGKALLAGKLGTWFLSSDEVWVRKDGVREDDARFERYDAEVPAHG